MMSLTVKVSRFDPSVDLAVHFETYEVPMSPGGGWTALQVLDYIHLNLDSTLSFYRHSTCNRGICARCAARINGKTRLLCRYIMPVQGDVVLEPMCEKIVAEGPVTR